MDKTELLRRADHTLLRPECTWQQIMQLCDEAVAFRCASVCIPPAYVARAAEYLKGALPVCTVIGFPNGYSTTAVKVFETAQAVESGAAEIDMVVNLGWVKDALWQQVEQEIRQVKAACDGRILKVIIETCLLTEGEKLALCRAVSAAGADYIKTSTGFSSAGATRADVALLRANVDGRVKVKAAGGIADWADAADFVALGADRLGTSRLVKLAQKQD